MSGCGARTAAGSLEAVFESSDVERFGWILESIVATMKAALVRLEVSEDRASGRKRRRT
jgi:hypothetical protein